MLCSSRTKHFHRTSTDTVIQLNPSLTAFRGSTNLICYRQVVFGFDSEWMFAKLVLLNGKLGVMPVVTSQ